MMMKNAWALGLSLIVLVACNTGTREEPVLPAAPALTSQVPSGTVTEGALWTYEVVVTGEPQPTLTVTNLPPWLSLNGATITGTPGTNDLGTTELIEVRASNDSGPDATQVFELTVEPRAPAINLTPALTNLTLTAPAGTVATQFNVETPYGNAAVGAGGALSAPVMTGQRQLLVATRNGNAALLGVANEPTQGGAISARSTAATLVFLNVGVQSAPAAQHGEAFAAIEAEPSLATLEAAVATDVAAGLDVLANPSSSLRVALQTASDAVATTLATRANAAQAPIPPYNPVPSPDLVSPSTPRSGIVVDAGQGRVVNTRRRHVFAASTLSGQPPVVGTFVRVPAANDRSVYPNLETLWKAYQSEGGFSILPPAGQLLVRQPVRYDVTAVGSSLRTNSWPSAGTAERAVFNRALAADCAQLHLDGLALILGMDLETLGGLESTIGEELGTEGATTGIETDIEARAARGPWALVQAFHTALSNNPGLRAQLDTSLSGRVDGAQGGVLDNALTTVNRLAAGLQGNVVADSPVLLYLTASDSVVQFTVTPGQGGGIVGFTVVLEWGATPTDLDSHLTGPQGQGRFHLYFPLAEVNGGSGGIGASLDLDDTSSFGPETTAITRLLPGVYRFSVHDFNNSLSQVSTALGDSGAKVIVFQGANPSPLNEFTVPLGAGTLWTVFELDGSAGTITPVNQLSFETSPANVQ